MKMKGVPLWLQHVGKIVVGVGVVVFLVLGAVAFLQIGGEVKMGGRQVAFSDIDNNLGRLKGEIEEGLASPSTLKFNPQEPQSDKYLGLLSGENKNDSYSMVQEQYSPILK